MKKELILIFGGRSGEHEVSLRSAASVYNHLDRNKYSITLIGIAKNGKWYLQDNPGYNLKTLKIECSDDKKIGLIPMEGFICQENIIRADIVFPVIHGTFGEDGKLQGLLEMGGFPYVGADVTGSSLGIDKDISKTVWISKGIAVVPYVAINKEEYSKREEENFNNGIMDKFNLPLFIKPAVTGSSLGVSKVEKKEQLSEAVKNAFQYDSKILVEPAIVGREIECSVIGNFEIESFPPGEVASTHNFYDYEAKYIDPDGAGLIIPANLTPGQAKELRSIAEKAYKALSLKGFARVDFFIEENSGRILLNEVNTIPGFTNISMFSMMCDVGGLPYNRLLDKLIELAEDQFISKERLKYSYTPDEADKITK